MQPPTARSKLILRTRLWYVLLLVLSVVVLVRLFYLQVIQHEYYRTAAYTGQLREYEIPAARGVIEAYNGGEIVPIVLNQTKYTLFADPLYIEDPLETAEQLMSVIGSLNTDELLAAMQADSRYQIIRKKLTKPVMERVVALELPGIGVREEPHRAYPQGALAAQLLGFVNDEGQGVYGIEEALNDQLTGKPGQLRAITDARGIPLAANQDNIRINPQAGDRLRLTIDVSVQKQLEDLLEERVDRSKAISGGALILNAQDGAVVAMANYPSYHPEKFFEVSSDEADVYRNKVVTDPLEIGSIMKPFTMAAALDQGVIEPDTTYHDPDQFQIDGATIRNVEESSGVGTRDMVDILQLSLNTGATWLLKQMGNGEINESARLAWHEYMTDHYFFDQPTGIEQGYEAGGAIPSPVDGFGLNIQFANTAFGQGMTATPLQAGAAFAAIINGGTYYQPRLLSALTTDQDGSLESIDPIVRREAVVSARVSEQLRQLLEEAFAKNYRTYGLEALPEGFSIGGKTGTAQIPRAEGGYYDHKFNGTFIGYVADAQDTYIIMVRIDEPQVAGYAGSVAAGPLFVDLAEVLMHGYGMQPKVN